MEGVYYNTTFLSSKTSHYHKLVTTRMQLNPQNVGSKETHLEKISRLRERANLFQADFEKLVNFDGEVTDTRDRARWDMMMSRGQCHVSRVLAQLDEITEALG